MLWVLPPWVHLLFSHGQAGPGAQWYLNGFFWGAVILGPYLRQMEVPGLGVKWSCSICPVPEQYIYLVVLFSFLNQVTHVLLFTYELKSSGSA